MNRIVICFFTVTALLLGAGCVGDDVDGDDYGDAPTEIQDGALDYQDYKEADCPYLNSSLDQATMEKCNEWIRNNQTRHDNSSNNTNTSPKTVLGIYTVF